MHPAILAEFSDARLRDLHTQAARGRRARVRRDIRPMNTAARWRVRLGARVIALGERLAGPATVGARTGRVGGAR